ncbi:putative multiheme cytochrome c [Thermincola ferriacetica]|uniref:Putative multiheme cytochrome c n=1 Tax=Thermincola ferriacetica TaxID=281456 RepID=A0A0L6W663_9FIRM|nr:cell-wall cytochrome A [Thermincola ferriacetica]KNZ71005.1 putative multiheme cytochrome c [Thermincola ferriacetica]
MKKLVLISLVAGLITLMVSANAFAEEPYYHGDFAADTTGCAKCHVTHAGAAKALLIAGPKQTDFCYYCHNGILKSPYDAENGQIETSTGLHASLAGGFLKTFDFDNKVYGTDDSNTANYVYSTSVHGVENYDSNDWLNGVQIPGGSNTLTGDFRCGSCHDPHAGGTYPAAGVMPRLLKKTLPAANLNPADHQDWEFTAVAASTTGGFKSKVVTDYGVNAGVWCAGCHDLFNQTAHNAGQTQETITGKYMHRMNFVINASQVTNIQHATIDKLALADNAGAKTLTCLTCHRAHGTASSVNAGLVFPRAASYLHGDGTAASNTQRSSVLLREKNRDVCYDCHGAAQYNTPTLQAN